MLSQAQIIERAREFVYQTLSGEGSGHDWWHIERVARMAVNLAEKEGADVFICELAALLHDMVDDKLTKNEAEALQNVKDWLTEHDVPSSDSAHIMDIITKMSFKGGNQTDKVSTLEGYVVQDADRLDAMGAIGIARVMCYSGHVNRPIHDPSMTPRDNLTFKEYRSSKDTAIMHFYEKLLTLKERMNTDSARALAQERHDFLLLYLEQFYAEWEGKR
ncbi:HD domain-containing protein [Streptococcus sp. zg-JUN1979]|uniref:HD domain-containing protein n=1 Tax=Streptococcus sp. zg-JUN1979 TaxID=3391450 RepID=UPI0039AF0249